MPVGDQSATPRESTRATAPVITQTSKPCTGSIAVEMMWAHGRREVTASVCLLATDELAVDACAVLGCAAGAAPAEQAQGQGQADVGVAETVVPVGRLSRSRYIAWLSS